MWMASLAEYHEILHDPAPLTRVPAGFSIDPDSPAALTQLLAESHVLTQNPARGVPDFLFLVFFQVLHKHFKLAVIWADVSRIHINKLFHIKAFYFLSYSCKKDFLLVIYSI